MLFASITILLCAACMLLTAILYPLFYTAIIAARYNVTYKKVWNAIKKRGIWD